MSGWDQRYDIDDLADELSRVDDERRARRDDEIDERGEPDADRHDELHR